MMSNPVNYLIFLLFLLVELLRYADKRLHWDMKEWHYSMILISIYLGFLGDNFFNLYYIFPFYDKFLHFMIPMMLTLIIIDSKIIEQKSLALFIVMTLSVFLEIGEYSLDNYFDTIMQGVFSKNQGNMLMDPLKDTIFDLITAFFGSMAGNIIFWKKIRKKSIPYKIPKR